MSYRFKRKETVDAGLRRIGAERLHRAISRLTDDRDPLEAVHEVRKDIKKLRALLRLIRPCLRQKVFRREARILRKTAALLAGVRDARVKLQTLDNITQQFKHQLGEHPFPNVRSALQSRCDREGKLFLENDSVDKVLAYLRKIESHLEEWRVNEDEWAAIEPGLLWSYRNGRRELQLVKDKPTPANFHNWRKRVKDLGYQLRLVRGAWPQVVRPTIEAVNKLGEHLGDDHDAAVLREALYDDDFSAPADEVDTLVALIEQRQRELRACAVDLAGRLYVEKPRRLGARMGAWWGQWRGRRRKLAYDYTGPVLSAHPNVNLAA